VEQKEADLNCNFFGRGEDVAGTALKAGRGSPVIGNQTTIGGGMGPRGFLEGGKRSVGGEKGLSGVERLRVSGGESNG